MPDIHSDIKSEAIKSEPLQAIRGMNDVLPGKAPLWRQIETIFASCMQMYGYHEIRLPILEYTSLFQRSIGSVTDIVEKEMYTFLDRNSESLTLRPEGTAGCVRACIEHGLLHQLPQKLWYNGPMFRYEKPQKGRYRQFHQMGVEVLGIANTAVELELLSMTYRLWEKLGLSSDLIQLQINTLGTLSERHLYREKLVDYLKTHVEHLDDDSRRRLHRNPLRILDSKHAGVQELLKNAPQLQDCLGEDSRTHFESLCNGLQRLNIPFTINPLLVRGLDYYSHTVFEWVTDYLGSQATVCAGGRYDALVSQMGGPEVPAVGFALGCERLILLMEQFSKNLEQNYKPYIYFISSGEGTLLAALNYAERLRSLLINRGIEVHIQGGSFKSQFKRADKSGAEFALIIGEQELQNDCVSVKKLRVNNQAQSNSQAQEQLTFSFDELVAYLTKII